MWVLPVVGYVGVTLGFLFLVLAIASGLYYLSELVEEHTVLSKKLLTRLIYSTIGLQLLLWLLDGFPAWLSVMSIVSHVVYLQNLRRFPIVKLTDPVFISSCVLVLLNHYFWFRHFSASPRQTHTPNQGYRRGYYQEPSYATHRTFNEVASFFGLCVWLVPFSLFVSLSASENVLPSMGSEYATGEGSSFIRSGKEPNGTVGSAAKAGGNAGMAKALVDNIRLWASESAEMMVIRRGERSRHSF